MALETDRAVRLLCTPLQRLLANDQDRAECPAENAAGGTEATVLQGTALVAGHTVASTHACGDGAATATGSAPCDAVPALQTTPPPKPIHSGQPVGSQVVLDDYSGGTRGC